MKKNAIVWRESIYKNDYKCSCGKKLFENGDVVNDVLFDTRRDELICPVCMKVVAKLMDEKEASKIAHRGETA